MKTIAYVENFRCRRNRGHDVAQLEVGTGITLISVLFSVLAGVAIFTRLSLPLTSFAVFRDREHPKNVISINNRYVFSVRTQIPVFVSLPQANFMTSSKYLRIRTEQYIYFLF